MEVAQTHILLGGFASFISAFAAFNIAYYNSDAFRKLFNKFKLKSLEDSEDQFQTIKKIVSGSTLSDEQKQGSTHKILQAQKNYKSKVKKAEIVVSYREKLRFYFFFSAIVCLAIVLVSGCENILYENNYFYNVILFVNLMFVMIYFIHFFYNLIYATTKNILFSVPIPVGFLAVGIYVKYNLDTYWISDVWWASLLSVILCIVVSVLPYFNDVLIGLWSYNINRKAHKKAKVEISKIHAFCENSNNLTTLTDNK